MPTPETLYLIDGYAAIFRAYHAIRHPLFSPVTGEPTQGVLVFAQMLLKLYTRLQPDYVVLALDAPGGTFRDTLFGQYQTHQEPQATVVAPNTPPAAVSEPQVITPSPPVPQLPPRDVLAPTVLGYKGTRSSMPNTLQAQMPRIRELLAILGIPVIQQAGWEADDVIATLTNRLLADPALSSLRIRIVTRDKDMEQLLQEGRVTIFDVHTEAETDVTTLWTKRGILPSQVVDFLALTGDTVDNIPGVDGIGPRTAAKLLQQFGSLDGIVENLAQVPERWRERLEKARPFLPLSRQLVTLHRDLDFPFNLDTARVRPLPADALHRFFEQLGFNRLKEQFAASPPSTAQ